MEPVQRSRLKTSAGDRSRGDGRHRGPIRIRLENDPLKASVERETSSTASARDGVGARARFVVARKAGSDQMVSRGGKGHSRSHLAGDDGLKSSIVFGSHPGATAEEECARRDQSASRNNAVSVIHVSGYPMVGWIWLRAGLGPTRYAKSRRECFEGLHRPAPMVRLVAPLPRTSYTHLRG